MDKNGTLNILKPAGTTSHDVVQTIRKISGQKRVGHTGTLDPMACGVLPICLGKSTRAIEYMDRNHKRYKCSMQFGMATDTQDIWGNLLKQDEEFKLINFKEDDIKKAFLHQKGDIMQIPPKYSAVKIGGKRLYEYARSGEDIEIKERPVSVYDIEIEEIDCKNNRVIFYVECSKGTYIRTICDEAGKFLGSFGTMTSLIRTDSSGFELQSSITLEELKKEFLEAGNIDRYIEGVEKRLEFMGHITIPYKRRKWFVNGGRLRKDEYIKEKEADTRFYNPHTGMNPDYFNTYVVKSECEDGACGPKEFLGTAAVNKEKELVVCKIMV